ncbi:MAG: tRNA lysidine(34) synthetase TilS [Tannerella sp.]|jgi:tRNA(Ile)-lysidine synthase|nr:tRNA lysidine(34) synthetase TilS [Tannerella sp.]
MLERVASFIRQHKLLKTGEPVLIGLSGGADSVALTAVLSRLGYPCLAAHCNFHLRGEESERDEAFARTFAAGQGISIRVQDFDTTAYAKDKHISIEMAAREQRYRWFEILREELGAQAIAVAHHRDDNAETMLLGLLRGSGIRGLRGMLPRQGKIVRPLLEIGRKEILAWLEQEGLGYVTDSSNLSDAYTRNFLRLDVFPLLEKLNPSAKEAFSRTAGHLRDVEAIYDSVVQEAKQALWLADGSLSISRLLRFPAPSSILYELLLPYGFSRQVSEEIFLSLEAESGRRFFSPAYRLVKDRDRLLLTPRKEGNDKAAYFIPGAEGLTHCGEWDFQADILDAADTRIEKKAEVAYFNLEKLHFPLLLRSPQTGDSFIPFGMKGKRKKLSDYFCDLKLSLPEKEKTLVLCSGDDLIWVVGRRTDERYKVDKHTKKVLRLNFSRHKDSCI